MMPKALTPRSPRRDHADIVREVALSAAAGRSAFAASWRRSLLHYQIDPGTVAAPDRLGAAELAERTEAAGRLTAVARPILDRLARAAADAGCSVLLSDAEGLVIDDRVRPADAGEFHGWGLVPGAIWSEAAEGTNGIGTCAAEKRPVTIWRDQHFRAQNIRLACMGAPVFGPDGELVGVIDVSSVREDLTEGYARLISLTTQDAAQRIEAELFRARWIGARILAPEAEEASGPVLLAIDADDLVVGASRAARRSFDLTPDRLGRIPAGDLLGFGAPQGLDGAERAELTRALARVQGNVSAAARELGIGRATFYRKMKALGIEA